MEVACFLISSRPYERIGSKIREAFRNTGDLWLNSVKLRAEISFHISHQQFVSSGQLLPLLSPPKYQPKCCSVVILATKTCRSSNSGLSDNCLFVIKLKLCQRSVLHSKSLHITKVLSTPDGSYHVLLTIQIMPLPLFSRLICFLISKFIFGQHIKLLETIGVTSILARGWILSACPVLTQPTVNFCFKMPILLCLD